MFADPVPEGQDAHFDFSSVTQILFGCNEESLKLAAKMHSMMLVPLMLEDDERKITPTAWPVNLKLRDLGRACALCFVWC